jgi:hypothetical protein
MRRRRLRRRRKRRRRLSPTNTAHPLYVRCR